MGYKAEAWRRDVLHSARGIILGYMNALGGDNTHHNIRKRVTPSRSLGIGLKNGWRSGPDRKACF